MLPSPIHYVIYRQLNRIITAYLLLLHFFKLSKCYVLVEDVGSKVEQRAQF